MEKMMKKFFRSSLITAILLIALGILLICQSKATITTIAYVLGGIIIALGVLAAIKFFQNIKEHKGELDLVYGIISVVLGIIIIKNTEAIENIMPRVLGVCIIISSSSKLQYAFELKANNNNLWKTTMSISIISTICGLVLLFNPFEAIAYFTKIVGVFIIIYAVLDLISAYTIRRNVKLFQKSIEEGITEAIVVKEEDVYASKEEKKAKKIKEKKED